MQSNYISSKTLWPIAGVSEANMGPEFDEVKDGSRFSENLALISATTSKRRSMWTPRATEHRPHNLTHRFILKLP